jgi:hypothetical protein
MKKNLFTKLIFLILVSIFYFNAHICAQENNKNGDAKIDSVWKYLGRPRPGLTTLRFPPDSLLATSSWMWHGVPVFSPDFKEIFWSKYDRIVDRGKIVFIKYINNNWTSMQYAPFGNQNYFESSPVYSLSGDTLFFASLRQGNIFFRTCRTSGGWTKPEPLNIPIPQGYAANFEFSIARNGTFYFSLVDTVLNTDADIYKSKLINGEYQMPVSLGPVINSDSNDLNPYIDPDERFIIFVSKRQGGFGLHDLYISKRKPDSTWNNPVNLGSTINSSFENVFPYITPDNLYFFYNTAKSGDIGYNPYWISVQYIYNLISIDVKNQNELVNDFVLQQNYPNPFNPKTNIKYEIKNACIVNLKIFNVLGIEVETLVNEKQMPGSYEADWNASKYPSGIYFYRLETENFKETKSMVLIK